MIMKECVSGRTGLKEDEGALNTYKKPPESRGIGECFCVVPGHTSVFRTYIRQPSEKTPHAASRRNLYYLISDTKVDPQIIL